MYTVRVLMYNSYLLFFIFMVHAIHVQQKLIKAEYCNSMENNKAISCSYIVSWKNTSTLS